MVAYITYELRSLCDMELYVAHRSTDRDRDGYVSVRALLPNEWEKNNNGSTTNKWSTIMVIQHINYYLQNCASLGNVVKIFDGRYLMDDNISEQGFQILWLHWKFEVASAIEL